MDYAGSNFLRFCGFSGWLWFVLLFPFLFFFFFPSFLLSCFFYNGCLFVRVIQLDLSGLVRLTDSLRYFYYYYYYDYYAEDVFLFLSFFLFLEVSGDKWE